MWGTAWVIVSLQSATEMELFGTSFGVDNLKTCGERPQAARLLRSWVRIPPGAWIFVCCDCRVFSGRGLCDELITRPEESYRLWCVVVCDLETSRMGGPYIQGVPGGMCQTSGGCSLC